MLILEAGIMCGSLKNPRNSSPETPNIRISPFGSATEETYAHNVRVGACHPSPTIYRILAKPPGTWHRQGKVIFQYIKIRNCSPSRIRAAVSVFSLPPLIHL